MKEALKQALEAMRTFYEDFSEGDMGSMKLYDYARDFHAAIAAAEAALAAAQEPVAWAWAYTLESPACRASFIDGIRRAERAHGITGDTHE